MSSVFRVET